MLRFGRAKCGFLCLDAAGRVDVSTELDADGSPWRGFQELRGRSGRWLPSAGAAAIVLAVHEPALFEERVSLSLGPGGFGVGFPRSACVPEALPQGGRPPCFAVDHVSTGALVRVGDAPEPPAFAAPEVADVSGRTDGGDVPGGWWGAFVA